MEALIILLLSILLMAFAVPFAMIGQGGGTAYVPLLEIAGTNIHEASTISLFMIAVSTISAAIVFHRKRTIDWHLLLYIIPTAAVGAFLGGYLAHLINASVITVAFAIFLCISAFLIYRQDYGKEGHMYKHVPKLLVLDRTYDEYHYSVSLGILIPAGFGLGFIAGTLGIGGGLFLLPVLILLFRVPLRITIGATTVYTGFSALIGLFGHIAGGDALNLGIALPLAVAVFIGARVGSQLSHKASVPKLKAAIAVILVALAAVMLLKTLGAAI